MSPRPLLLCAALAMSALACTDDDPAADPASAERVAGPTSCPLLSVAEIDRVTAQATTARADDGCDRVGASGVAIAVRRSHDEFDATAAAVPRGLYRLRSDEGAVVGVGGRA